MIFFRWVFGIAIGTFLIAITSPLFVRSYVPRVQDPVRRVAVLAAHSNYRWRAEGYATTQIGPLGMPGQRVRPENDSSDFRVALWGDSQMEGVCVADDEKIFAMVEHLAGSAVRCFPFARSGDDCNDWLGQIESISNSSTVVGRIDLHVLLIVQWDDWCRPILPPRETSFNGTNVASEYLPGFLIQAVRNTVTSGPENQLRSLRFRPGPIVQDARTEARAEARTEAGTETLDDMESIDRESRIEYRLGLLSAQLDRLKKVATGDCLFVYAPLCPAIRSGKIDLSDPDENLFERFQHECSESGFHCVDVRTGMIEYASVGRWPRGFHNGQIGAGHYNKVGNQIIAKAIARRIRTLGSSLAHSGE